ncbi:Cysteine desulfurase (TRNA sulfurtransferase), PLP-dependent [Frankia canadensis]|uniref:Cysteine desulfurase (TRNA sulfurtransferase), PLP-dependent n=1 Tax=Frankia canadensis TaxID=1836972 RepID=A0A2I2KZX3_9ACTN|nr:cysteine desulfurase family protein [Frankia canadensis]SNQ51216.1 Cysteine desulfurase (TRNA sulfurtransferase), PLP-dependent [Frankia canadensis]SOU58506.1 Cysteine desulfurase (TRNA sulfurtransferase), PLP-dependent [Frankia canadensis]
MPAYLDHASTTPLHPVARQALLVALDEGWADPARLYREGRHARRLLDAARETVAGVLGARPDEISFTASGATAATLALLGTAAARRRAGDAVMVSAVEHSSVLHAARHHEQAGGRVVEVGVDRLGRVDPAAFTPVPGTAVASLQHANHEVGTLQPVAEVAERLHNAGVPLHTDAAVTVGHIPVDLGALGADLLTASAHKYGGPAGVGILVVRTGTRWRDPRPGAGPDAAAGGFPDVPSVVAAAAALAARATEIAEEAPRLAGHVAELRRRLPSLIDDVELLGDPAVAPTVGHISAFSCLYVEGEALLDGLDRAGIAVSSGSSCTSDVLTPSHVLVAMGALTHGNLRVSFGRDSTQADLDALLDVLPGVVRSVRASLGAPHLGA